MLMIMMWAQAQTHEFNSNKCAWSLEASEQRKNTSHIQFLW